MMRACMWDWYCLLCGALNVSRIEPAPPRPGGKRLLHCDACGLPSEEYVDCDLARW